MFARLYNSIREIVNREPERTTNNSNKHSEIPPGEYVDSARRSSVTEELQKHDTHNMFSNNHTAANGLNRSNSVASAAAPISINDPASRRRSSTIFNISNITADDYVQKDLISSSWS
ncbi:unnamed protein product [Mucor hiemalis]